MRVAFVGKGGAGKSAIAGTFARLLARRGEPVLAIDSDPLPGLAFSLGLPIDHTPPIPDVAIEERAPGGEGPRWRLRTGLDPAAAIVAYSVLAPDGVRFFQFGKIKGQQNLFRSQVAFHNIVNRLPDDDWNVVGDLPGGTRQAFGGWGNYA
ncbi:MAG: ArsA-related P-loop ATPase, partial [Acidimicrobiales bacterium]